MKTFLAIAFGLLLVAGCERKEVIIERGQPVPPPVIIQEHRPPVVIQQRPPVIVEQHPRVIIEQPRIIVEEHRR